MNTLTKFEQITGKAIGQYLQRALRFFQQDYPLLEAYYAGNLSSVKSDPFATLAALEAETQVYLTAFQTHGVQLNNSRWWFLLEEIEQIDSRLKTIRNISRWARSTRSNTAFNNQRAFDYVMPAGQTLERISRDMLKEALPEDSWAEIAIGNNIREEDYTPDGGVPLKLTQSAGPRTIQVSAVVDTMEGKRILGKDLHRALQFADNDLLTLTEEETVFQSVEILASLKVNDNPHAPNDGLQTAVIIGGNRASLNFPVISRQMTATFASDDTLKDFQINDIRVVNDTLRINYQVSTRLNETIEASITI
ncbi:hypothetical protein SAMN05444266_102212 [Chitinophaga jiangningensis]|uniref:Uncharacterized protein n=1 Tax=Chitinophaga jiangningensis TaxID=1419482 RepID=A0A1M6YA06_9BACT|nr:hypothetical protein [Chitinophaga jiangningensis]SHL14835.1 hypothetical protein SAMN05444266_102212 [Chitinophaga jiangningensis]